MKKIISYILILIIIASVLCSCGKNKTSETADPTEAPSETTEYETTLYSEFDTSCVKKLGDYKSRAMTKDLTVYYKDIIDAYSETLQTIYNSGESDGEEADETAAEAKTALEGMLIKDGIVEKYDIISFNYLGKIDGEAFSGGTSENVISVMGAGNFITGFEEAIIGNGIGKEFDINVTFPENYTATLAGKEAVFTIKVNFIFPRLTEEAVGFLNKYTGTSYDDKAAYIAAVASETKESLESSFEQSFLSKALSEIKADSEFGELPELEIKKLKSYYESLAENYGYDLDSYMQAAYGYTTDDQIESFFEHNVSVMAIIAKIVQNEKLAVTDEEYDELLSYYCTQYGYESIEEIEKDIDKNSIYNNILVEKVYDFLSENIKIEVKESTEVVYD